MRVRLIHVASLLSTLLFASCTLTLDTAPQCELPSDCEALGFTGAACDEGVCIDVPFNPVSCRDEPWLTRENPDVEVTLSFTTFRLQGRTGYADLSWYVCPNLDPECSSPIGDPIVTDAEGRASIALPQGFRGHIYAPTPSHDPTLAPSVFKMLPPPEQDDDFPEFAQFVVTDLGTLGFLANLGGEQLVPGTGQVFFQVVDCAGQPFPDVSVSVVDGPEDSFSVYLSPGSELDFNLNATTTLGEGALLNAPSGFQTVEARHPEYGIIFTQAVNIQPDSVTGLTLRPSPN